MKNPKLRKMVSSLEKKEIKPLEVQTLRNVKGGTQNPTCTTYCNVDCNINW